MKVVNGCVWNMVLSGILFTTTWQVSFAGTTEGQSGSLERMAHDFLISARSKASGMSRESLRTTINQSSWMQNALATKIHELGDRIRLLRGRFEVLTDARGTEWTPSIEDKLPTDPMGRPLFPDRVWWRAAGRNTTVQAGITGALAQVDRQLDLIGDLQKGADQWEAMANALEPRP